jgi:hypothetical protein
MRTVALLDQPAPSGEEPGEGTRSAAPRYTGDGLLRSYGKLLR